MPHFVWLAVIALLLCARSSSAFVSNSINERTILVNGLPTSQQTISFLATNLDSQGTFAIGQCTGSIIVNGPVFGYVTVPAGNVPRDVVSVQESACVVPDVNAYEAALQAQGEGLDLVWNSSGDNQTAIPFDNSTGADNNNRRRRRLLQQQDNDLANSGPGVKTFGAMSSSTVDSSYGSLSTSDSLLLQALLNFQQIDWLLEEQVLTLNSIARITIKALNQTLDIISLLQQRAQNTDAALAYLTQFSVNAFNMLANNVSQLFYAQNVTNQAVLTLYNAFIQNLQDQVTVNQATQGAITGLQNLRLADKSELRQWIDQQDLKDLSTKLYFNDLDQVPSGYTPYQRHPGVRPTPILTGEDARILVDSIVINSVYTYPRNNTPINFRTGITVNEFTFNFYMNTEFAFEFDATGVDSATLLSQLGPSQCVPSYTDATLVHDPSYYGTFATSRFRSNLLTQQTMQGIMNIQSSGFGITTIPPTFSNTSCTVWAETTWCSCWQNVTAFNGSYPTFTWSSYTPFQQGGQPNISTVCQSFAPWGYQLSCITQLARNMNELNRHMTAGFCDTRYQNTTSFFNISYPQTIWAVNSLDSAYVSGYRTQLRANTTVPDGAPLNPLAPGARAIDWPLGQGCLVNNLPLYGDTGSQMWQAQNGGLATQTTGLLYNAVALLTAGYPLMQADLAKLRLKKQGRIAGVETINQPTNLYTGNLYDANGNLIYDSATPLYCQQANWNAYASATIPLNNFQASPNNLVTTNIVISLSCPPCTNPFSCYNITSLNATKDVQIISPGALVLNSNFIVLGDIDPATLTELYDPPPQGLVISAVLESRAYTPTYILLPPNTTTTPNYTEFAAISQRNPRYTAFHGTVSPQAYLQQPITLPNGQVVCSTAQRIAGAQWCSIRDEFNYTWTAGTNGAGTAQFQDVNDWSVRFSITIPSGEYFDTVDIASECPLVTLRPIAGGGLFLLLQNDASATIQVAITYQPIEDVGVSCPSACCVVGQLLTISPRYQSYYQIPPCPFGNLSISVELIEANSNTMQCFNDSGVSLANQIQSASDALGLNDINQFNTTQVYQNQYAIALRIAAYNALIAYQETIATKNAEITQLIANLTASRDRWQRELLNAQLLTGFTPAVVINTTDLANTVGGLLTENKNIDANITAQMDIIRGELAVAQNLTDYVEVLGEEVIAILNNNTGILNMLEQELAQSPGLSNNQQDCGGTPGNVLGQMFLGNFDPLTDAINCDNAADDSSCPGFIDAIKNSLDFTSSKPGIGEWFACIGDILINIVIGIAVVIGAILLFVCCAPLCPTLCGCCGTLVGWVGHGLDQQTQAYRQRQQQQKRRQKNKSYSPVRRASPAKDVEEEEEDEGAEEAEQTESSSSRRKRYID